MAKRQVCGFVGVLVSWLFCSQVALAQSFNYVTAQELKKQMDTGNAPMVVDVQSERDFARGHLPEAISTKAFPVSTPDQRERLKPVVAQILASSKNVVIVCPAGADAAENAYKFLKEQGVPEQRLSILKGGQSKYPYFNVVRDK
jgi:rhodanese-related sulfurtransferase